MRDNVKVFDKQYTTVINRIQLIVIICVFFQFITIGFFTFFQLISPFNLGVPIHGPFNVIYKLTFPIFSLCTFLIQILLIIKGLKVIVGQDPMGKNLLRLSLLFLVLSITSIPISLIFFWDSMAWGPFGIMAVNFTLLEFNSLTLLWFLFVIIVLAGSVISFGIFLLNTSNENVKGNFKISGIFFLLQTVCFIAQFHLFFNSYLEISLLGYTLLIGLLNVIGFFSLGIGLRQML